MRKALLWTAFGVLLTSSQKAFAESMPSHQGTQYIVLIDVSASRSQELLDSGRQFLDRLADTTSFGDQVILLPMQETGLSTPPRPWKYSLQTPKDTTYITHLDTERLAQEKNSIKREIAILVPKVQQARVLHTDILTSISVASELIQDRGSRSTELIILSDMLQSTPQIEMEGLRRMPPAGWLQRRVKQGLVPNLGGACVLVVGADAMSTQGLTVRSFWQRYFQAGNASLSNSNYRYTPPDAIPHCP